MAAMVDAPEGSEFDSDAVGHPVGGHAQAEEGKAWAARWHALSAGSCGSICPLLGKAKDCSNSRTGGQLIGHSGRWPVGLCRAATWP